MGMSVNVVHSSGFDKLVRLLEFIKRPFEMFVKMPAAPSYVVSSFQALVIRTV